MNSIDYKDNFVKIKEQFLDYFESCFYISHNSSLPNSKKTDIQNKCCLNIPAQYVLDPSYKPSSDKKRLLASQKYSQFWREACKGLPSDEALRASVKTFLDTLLYYGFEDSQGKWRTFTANAKGTTRYNKKVASQIQDQLDYFSNLGWETFALTITYDVEKFGKNRIKAWKMYTKHINNVLENLRKHYQCQYLWVKESTKNGYPHAHIVVCLPPNTVKGYKHMQNGKSLHYGWIYNYFKSRVDSRIFELQAIKGKNVKYYLTKYISKFSEEDINSCNEENHEFTDAERKRLYCLFFTKVTNTRQWGSTKYRYDDEDEEKLNENSELSSAESSAHSTPQNEPERIFQSRATLRAKRAHLIKLCTNPPCGMLNPLYSAPYKDLNGVGAKVFDKKDLENPENIEKIKSVMKPIHCSGCFWSEFCFLVSGQPSKLYKIMKTHLKECEYRAIVHALLPTSPDQDFLDAVYFVYNFFMELLNKTNATFKTLAENSEQIYHMKYFTDFQKYVDAKKDIAYLRSQLKESARFDKIFKLKKPSAKTLRYRKLVEEQKNITDRFEVAMFLCRQKGRGE